MARLARGQRQGKPSWPVMKRPLAPVGHFPARTGNAHKFLTVRGQSEQHQSYHCEYTRHRSVF
jgi:hypothetical protein